MNYTKYYMQHNVFAVGIITQHWKQFEISIQFSRGLHVSLILGPLYLSLTHYDKQEREWLTAVFKEAEENI